MHAAEGKLINVNPFKNKRTVLNVQNLYCHVTAFRLAFFSKMCASLFNLFGNWAFLLTNPISLAIVAFQVWMLIHALRNREWLWAFFILIGSGLGAIFYYFSVYRVSEPSGFELPGAQSRARIKELEAKIHHLDNAYHHFQLGDIYFQRGKFTEAEKCYRAALERDGNDIDVRAHLGQCLLRLGRPAEARPLLEAVMNEKPDHDYGYTMMALAETLAALGESDHALLYWQHITQNHSYPRAKVQLAELYAARNQPEAARAELKDVLTDDTHAPAFQRARDRVWVRRARSLMAKLQ